MSLPLNKEARLQPPKSRSNRLKFKLKPKQHETMARPYTYTVLDI
jgi:hypothetical protein